MSRITILDPTAPPQEVDADPGPGLATTRGARIGFRFDPTWRSFDWIRDEWARLFAADAADVTHWCAGDRTGEAAEATRSSLQAFLEDRQALVAGLGN